MLVRVRVGPSPGAQAWRQFFDPLRAELNDLRTSAGVSQHRRTHPRMSSIVRLFIRANHGYSICCIRFMRPYAGEAT